MLVVKKIIDNHPAEDSDIVIKDKKKIKEVLSLVEGVHVENIENEQAMNKIKSGTVYIFGFFNENKSTTQKGEYAFSILEDGSIIFTYDNINNTQTPVITTQKQKDKLNKIKQLLNIL
ncbi:hypothetical protein [Saliterribacillus persicus]|uniref:Uncharacterized protein n=1 Tax=Saliterribacillus persicus TaxID=930114 RepID=A0A368YAM3_9BACI|nr:hypothetical protein [Saliterribacillus persicus]RCW77310.1 hypothetical protein DFR57_101179 [Saliterribacillus persicus]